MAARAGARGRRCGAGAGAGAAVRCGPSGRGAPRGPARARAAPTEEAANDGTWSVGTLLKGFAGLKGEQDEADPVGPASGLEDLSDRLPDCPRTRWDFEGVDLAATQAAYREAEFPECPKVLERAGAEGSEEAELAWLAANREEIKADLVKHGAVLIKGMQVTRQGAGFRRMYDALGFDVCLDPIHTSGLRKFATEEDGIYEEVNKPALRQHYIGLHNESTTNRTAAFGAFVCFQPATGGGDFFVADGKRILRDMDADVLQRLMDRKVRISVSNLDFFKPVIQDRGFPNEETSKKLVARSKDDLAKLIGDTVAPKFDMDLEMVWGADGANEGYRLQAIELAESPVNRHPVTKEPLWFCNLHNHSRHLRDNRPCTVPEVGMTETFYGDLSPIPVADLEEIDRASRANIVPTPMTEGDVLLVDNYRVLHGRDIFTGDRCHAVSWFTWPEEAGIREAESNSATGNNLNKALNKYVDSLAK